MEIDAHKFLLWTALILGSAFLGAVAMYFPSEFWTPPRTFAMGMVPLSLSLFVYVARVRSIDVGLAITGVIGVLCFVHLLATLSVFALAIGQWAHLTLALCIANLAFGALIAIIVRVIIPLVANEIERNATSSEYARIAETLAIWSSVAEDIHLRESLLALSSELRYFPRQVSPDEPLPGSVEKFAAELACQMDARAWGPARDALAALRLELELSRQKNRSRHTRA